MNILTEFLDFFGAVVLLVVVFVVVPILIGGY